MDREQIFDSLKAGASGYLIKNTPPAKLLEAITEVHAGGAPMSNVIARKVVQFFQQQRFCDRAEGITTVKQQFIPCAPNNADLIWMREHAIVQK